jgi:hypothetical protein
MIDQTFNALGRVELGAGLLRLLRLADRAGIL